MALSTTQYGYIIDPMVPFTDDKGKTIKNGFVRVFVAGSSTPVVTYRNFDGATNTYRIELDNSGRTMTSVIGSKGLTYKVCVYDQHHSQESPILTVDKVSVIGANITAGTGATVVTGLDGLTTKPDGFVDASVIGTDGYVALDHTIVTDDLDTDAKVTAVEDDRYIPLLNEDVNDPDSKMKLGRLWKWVLGKIKSLSTTITAFRTGDYIVVDGPSGTAKMGRLYLLQETAENALSSIHSLSNTASESDLVAGNYLAIDGSAGTKQLPANLVVSPTNLSDNINTYGKNVVCLVSYKSAPDTLNEGESYYNVNDQIVTKFNGSLVYDSPKKTRLYYYDNSLYTWNGSHLVKQSDAYEVKKIVSASSLASDVIGNYIAILTNNKFLATRMVLGDSVVTKGLEKSKIYIYNGTAYSWNGTHLVPQCDFATEDLAEYFIPGYYIDATSTSINFNLAANGGFTGCLIEVKAGDIFIVSAAGGSSPRAFAIAKTDGEILNVAAANTTLSNFQIFIEQDGFLVVNSARNGTYKISRMRKRVSAEECEFGYNVGVNQFFNVNVAGNVGDTPTLVLGTDSQWAHEVYDVTAGEEFKISGQGGSAAKLFCFVDGDGKIAYTAPSTFSAAGLVVSAPCDGKLYVNVLRTTAFSVSKKGTAKVQIPANFEKERSSLATAEFEHSSDMFDFTEAGGALDGITFGSGLMASIYAKFDALIAAAPHCVKKYDAYNFTGVTKPAYASGYETYMYKITWDNWSVSNDRIGLNSLHKKRVMLILGGVHGNEQGAQANCYVFAENLVKCKNKDYFSILSAYDVYIVPVVNGYGSINETRTNGNEVNINRNYPTPDWVLEGAGTPNYSGPSAGSEQETKLIVKLMELLDPNVAIDHHNYFGGTQFYCLPPNFISAREAYKALIDVSFAAIKNYPQYFGSVYQFIANPSSAHNVANIDIYPASFGSLCKYSPNPSLTISGTAEMNGCISFDSGVPSGNIGGYGSEASSAVGEYMLRAFALRYAEYDLNFKASEINGGYISKI